MAATSTASQPARKALRTRGDLLAVGVVALLVAAAVAVGYELNKPGSGVVLWAKAAPLYGGWLPHDGPGTITAIVVAGLVVLAGPTLAARLSWGKLLTLGYVATLCWLVALAMIDGWRRGFTGRLATNHEYLHEVGGITDIPRMLSEFSDRILSSAPEHWTTHVAGHPPGATLFYVWLDRVGLGGDAWAAAATVAVGALIVVAIPVTLVQLDRAEAARACLPFIVLFPGAVWLAVSADAMFTGVTAVGVALLACAGRRFRDGGRGAIPLALAAGVLLGFGIFLSYGLPLLGLVALAVVVVLRSGKAFAYTVVGALAVVAVFAFFGFWWFDGYHLVVDRYYEGIASRRPYSYWVWGNLAALAIAVGPAVVAGVRRLRGWGPLVAVVGAALVAIAAADISGLSKAEVERIWLPFAVWLLPATALLPDGSRRWWLAAQAALALAVNHCVLTIW